MIGEFDGWSINIGSSLHVCNDRAMSKTYMNKKMLLGVSHTTNVADIGEVKLDYTSEKSLILKDVMHTPDIIKSLVSGFLLNKEDFSQYIGVDLYTITKNDIFMKLLCL